LHWEQLRTFPCFAVDQPVQQSDQPHSETARADNVEDQQIPITVQHLSLIGSGAAEREKKSKAQLSRMRARSASTAPGRFVAWCKQEQASLQQQLELMLAGKVLTGENRGSGWVDTTGESIERAKSRLAEVESLLTEEGAATISKP
jgi:hypothetical protein